MQAPRDPRKREWLIRVGPLHSPHILLFGPTTDPQFFLFVSFPSSIRCKEWRAGLMPPGQLFGSGWHCLCKWGWWKLSCVASFLLPLFHQLSAFLCLYDLSPQFALVRSERGPMFFTTSPLVLHRQSPTSSLPSDSSFDSGFFQFHPVERESSGVFLTFSFTASELIC